MKKLINKSTIIKLSIAVTLSFISVVLVSNYFKTIKVNNLKSIVNEPCYYSFSNGYTFNVGDSIKISKFTDDSNYIFEITNVITKNKKVFQPSNEIFDLSDKKFHNLNHSLVTDHLIADSAGIYILTLKNDRNTFHDVFFVNQTNIEPKIKIVLSDYTWCCYNSFGGKSNYIDKITPKSRIFIDNLRRRFNFLAPLGKHSGGSNSVYKPSTAYHLAIKRPNLSNKNEIETFLKDNMKVIEGKKYHLVVSELPLIKLLYNNYPNQFQILDCKQFADQSYSNSKGLIIFNGHTEYWSSRMIGRLNSEKTKNNILFLSGNNMFRKVERLNGFLTVNQQIMPKEVISPILGTFYTSTDYDKNSSLILKDTSHFLFEGINKMEIGGEYVASVETDKINMYTGSNVTVLASGKNILCDVVLVKNNENYLLNLSSNGSYNGLAEPNFNRFIKNFIDFSIK